MSKQPYKRVTLIIACFLAMLLVAKFYIGFYQLYEPSHKSFFVKRSPVWKSTFYSPRNKENKAYKDLSEVEKNEEDLFSSYALWEVFEDLSLFSCGDLFSRFANKPKHLEFIRCERFPHGQTIVKAIYRVSGKHAIDVENTLIRNYKMPPMKIFVHTGYEPAGYGLIDVEAIKRIHPYLDVLIDMGGYARKEISIDKDGKEIADFSLYSKEEVPYFDVTVSITLI